MLKINAVMSCDNHVVGFDVRHGDHPGAIEECNRLNKYHSYDYTWHYNWMFARYEFYEKV